jgi:Secretion system C-terminal sorting domain
MKKLIFGTILTLGILVPGFFSNTLKSQGIILVNDTIDLTPLIPKTVNILANDVIPPGDSIKIICGGGMFVHVTGQSGGFVTFVENYYGINWGAPPVDMGSYHLTDYTLDTNATALLIFRIRDYSYDSLYLNNINARFEASGSHFFGPDHGRFEVPKFSGKNTIFLSTFWIGGLDQDSVLHLAAQTYGQGPTGGNAHSHFDFWAGPVMDSGAYSIYQDTLWNYVWNLTKQEIEFHKAHWGDAGYQPIHDILTWPGNGNISLGQAAQLAPFFDRNSDGIYNPMDGDYPLIRGDQALFFIFNDDRNIHTETQGDKLKMEVHGMAYAFNLPQDSAFWNTVFLNYKIINRSDKIYYSTYLGVFTDLDIGYPFDDYVGCDVERGYYYGYNGTPIDGSGQSYAYGANPPAQSVTILGGPLMDPDGVDNPRFDNNGHPLCNESINGTHFGDSIIDNERLGMSRFLYYNNDGTIYGNPAYAIDYYNYLRGKWQNGDSTSVRFFFPGQSDTLNWGTGCVLTPNSHLTEVTAGNAPGDRRGVGSSGPFTFNPGQAEEFDLAYTFARDYTGNYPGGSIGKLQNWTDNIRKSFTTNLLPDGNSFNGIVNKTGGSVIPIQIFPNPASSLLYIRFDGNVNEPVNIRIYNANGLLIRSERRTAMDRMITLDLTGLSSGLYLVSVETKDQTVTKKLSIIK